MKAIVVEGGDFLALNFTDMFNGEEVSSLIENFETTKEKFIEQEGEDVIIEVREFGEVSKEFREFLRGFMDYDQQKNSNFFFEDEKISLEI